MPFEREIKEHRSCTHLVINDIIYAVLLIFNCCFSRGMRVEKSAYQDIIIDIREAVPASNCNVVLENLEITLQTASSYLFASLDGRVYFGSIIINLPNTWPDSCIPNERDSCSPSQGGKSDFTITEANLLFGDKIWTQQSGGCGTSGDQIYIPYRSLEGKNVGKEFVKEWAKYRYGVFDEIGFYDDKIYPQCYFTDSIHVTGCSDNPLKDIGLCTNPNPYADMAKTLNRTARTSLMYVPQSESVTMFCDEGNHDRYAPTKHNLLCDRKSTLEVILRHADFSSSNIVSKNPATIINTIPQLYYRRRMLTRYIVVIDETPEILSRESWSFLRNAIRKWVMYDLYPNTEVGIVLAGGAASSKILPITKLNVQKNRDLVASFVPYAPNDSTQAACISCAIRKSLDVLEEHRKNQGNASHAIVVISPGMDLSSDYHELVSATTKTFARIITINFPSILRHHPLDELASLSEGSSFTIQEKKYNSEKSYLDTYFELTEILFHISQAYYEGPAYQTSVEIHRKKLVDLSSDFATQYKRPSRVVQGTFFLDENMGYPSGFFIYIHNAETPLIHNVRLISPTGLIYNTRSDQRMPVKQLTLLASINETGAWAYMIERFNGNPQPHFVQVVATPVSEAVNIVRSRAWITALQKAGPFIVYCEVKRGDYPVLSALVKVRLTRPNVSCNYTNCEIVYKLLDTGAGDPDITKDDGVYSRYVSINTGPGLYKFEVFVDDNGNTAYSLQDNAVIQNIPCCGSNIPTKQTRQTVPFQRYLPPISLYLTQKDIDSMIYIPAGRIGDLTVTYLDEGKVGLSWTTPDMGGESVARYEIKFAFTIEDIIDRYETAAIMWNHDTPYPYEIGDLCNFILDINLEPRLFGQAVFFAIRPYAKLATNAMGGRISNAVRTYIPNKILSTNAPPLPPSTSEFFPEQNGSGFDGSIPGNNTYGNDNIDSKVMYSIPIIAGTLLILLLIGIFYLLAPYRHRRARKHQHSRHTVSRQNSISNDLQRNDVETVSTLNRSSSKATPSGSPIHLISNESSSIHATTTTIIHNYSTLNASDHHTVGIPIYKNEEDIQKARISSSGSFNGNIQAASSDYLVDELKPRPVQMSSVPVSGYYAANCSIGGLSIISTHSENATLSHPAETHPILSPYQSWTASQLLHEHERCTSPIDKLMNKVNLKHSLHMPDQVNNIDTISLNGCSPPPVPPLPYTTDIYQQFQFPHIYATMPKQHAGHIASGYNSDLHSAFEQQQPQNQHSISYNHKLGLTNGGCSDNVNPASDKKRRNITMV